MYGLFIFGGGVMLGNGRMYDPDPPRREPPHVLRYHVLAASPIRSDEEQAEAEALRARLEAEGVHLIPELVPREEIPPYLGDEEA